MNSLHWCRCPVFEVLCINIEVEIILWLMAGKTSFPRCLGLSKDVSRPYCEHCVVGFCLTTVPEAAHGLTSLTR